MLCKVVAESLILRGAYEYCTHMFPQYCIGYHVPSTVGHHRCHHAENEVDMRKEGGHGYAAFPSSDLLQIMEKRPTG